MIQGGAPKETIILLLMLPIIATFIVATRQIIGIKAFGIYTPLIITFAFFDMGIKYGLVIFMVVLLAGTVVRYFVKHFRLLYLPRMGIVLTVTAIAILILLFEGVLSRRTVFINSSIFSILIMITLAEKFIAAQIEKGLKTAVILSLETLIISVMGYYILKWPQLQNFIFVYPQTILLTLAVNIFLGRWNGLRLNEYFRFKDLLKS